jgi:hypothetical protein
MEEGMLMIRLTGILELAVPISKLHHEHITTINPETRHAH